MDIDRLLTNVCSHDLEQSKHFYMSLFNFNIGFESDWFIHLVSKGKNIEIGIISETNEVVPEQVRGLKAGVYLTFVVGDIDKYYAKAKDLDITILQPPMQTSYGQKRMLVVAPEGTVCDVSSPN